MKQLLTYFLLACLAVFSAACTPGSNGTDDQELKITGVVLPSSITAETGEEVVFRVVGNGPQATDSIVLVNESGEETTVTLSKCEAKSFGFIIPDHFYSDEYSMYIERGKQRVLLGKLNINITLTISVTPDPTSTIYGLVLCKGRPMADVVVSDGYEVVKTNADGVYQMASQKKHGYVFVSIPSGYTFRKDGAFPVFYQYTLKNASTLEQIDFNLVEDPGQDQHTMIVMGDIHLANRNNDLNQFANFVSDLNNYISSNSSTKFYGLTLGDLAWDQYWISNSYDLTNYKKDMSKLTKIDIFNTIGNHDHEQNATGDFLTVSTYKNIIGPTYYSFNIGKIHYVALDDIECTNSGNGDRTYNTKILQEQIDWLQKDLQFVSESTPVVLSMHSPVYNETGSARLTNYDKMLAAVGSRPCHIMTGHTHIMYNIEKSGHFEHNAGAVCATWWWTGSQTPGIHVATDGAPGGYLIFDVNGTDFKWQFKGTGKPVSHQFRTFDRNEIHLTAAKYAPSANDTYVAEFNKKGAVKAYANASTANEVFINIWNWDPTWKVEVTENGKSLQVNKTGGYDPLHFISYPAKRTNSNKDVTFDTGNTTHMFKVTASAPNTTLSIKVTDRFGNVYTEEMTRPKAFTVENYL